MHRATGRRSAVGRIADTLARAMIRAGVGPKTTFLLTVPGRRTGQPRTTPVSVALEGDGRYLVSQRGESEWVRNARVAKAGTLARRRRAEQVRLVELSPEESVSALRAYLRIEPYGRRIIGLGPDASEDELLEAARRHPVFRVEPL